jgi:hypothetical protein
MVIVMTAACFLCQVLNRNMILTSRSGSSDHDLQLSGSFRCCASTLLERAHKLLKIWVGAGLFLPSVLRRTHDIIVTLNSSQLVYTFWQTGMLFAKSAGSNVIDSALPAGV